MKANSEHADEVLYVEIAAGASVSRLNGSERGRMTCKLLRDFLKSNAVQGLDGDNGKAVANLVKIFMLGGGREANIVMAFLNDSVDRHSLAEGGKNEKAK